MSLRAITRMSIGGVNPQAIAAIENACLDIKAKALGVPVYELFGGPFRDRINLYWSHCGSFRVWRKDFFEKELGLAADRTLDDIKQLGAEVKAAGFKSLKTNPLALRPDDPPFMPGFRMMPNFLEPPSGRQAIRNITRCSKPSATARARRGAAHGPQLQPAHRRLHPHRQGARDLNLAWLECDIHDPEALALLRRSTTTPIASLETIHGLQAFKPFIASYSWTSRLSTCSGTACGNRCVSPRCATPSRWTARRIISPGTCRATSARISAHRSRTTASWNTTSTRRHGATTCSPTRR